MNDRFAAVCPDLGRPPLAPRGAGVHTGGMQRRTWLKLGLGSAIAFALAGGLMSTMGPGLTAAGGLSDGGRDVLKAISRGVLDGALPVDAQTREAELHAQLERLERYVAGLPPAVRAELSQLLGILASPAGRVTFAGLDRDWARASETEVQAALESMRQSRLLLRRQAYQALRDLAVAGYYSQPVAWELMGYPGPTDL